MPVKDSVVKFRLFMKGVTMIASKNIDLRGEPDTADVINKDVGLTTPSLTDSVIAEFAWFSSTFNLSFMNCVMLVFCAVLFYMTQRMPRELAKKNQLLLILSCLLFLLVPDVNTVYDWVLAFSWVIMSVLCPRLYSWRLCIVLLFITVTIVFRLLVLHFM